MSSSAGRGGGARFAMDERDPGVLAVAGGGGEDGGAIGADRLGQGDLRGPGALLCELAQYQVEASVLEPGQKRLGRAPLDRGLRSGGLRQTPKQVAGGTRRRGVGSDQPDLEASFATDAV